MLSAAGALAQSAPGQTLAGAAPEAAPRVSLQPLAHEPAYGAPVTFAGSVGQLYPGDGPLAVLMLSAIGYEEMCVRTTWRALAEEISASGAPCLRFDYPGVGDALEPASPQGIEDWLESARAAARFLRAAAGRERIVVVGQGLGGALAALAAREIGGVEAAVFMAPVTSGKTYLRELSLWARMLTDRIGIGPDPDDAGGHAVAGLALGEERARAIKALDLSKIAEAPAAKALMVGRVNHGGDERFAAHLEALGADVSRLDYEGYEILATDPTQATPPVKLLRQIADWIVERGRETPFDALTPRLVASAPPEAAPLFGESFSEIPLRFGPGGRLFGVLCEPERPSGRPAVIFANAGRDYHIGWARATIEQARALARAGVASLRFDAAGIGDSPAAPQATGEVLYGDGQIDDMIAAVDCMTARGHARPTLLGRCSGAYAVFHAAVRDPRVGEAVMINTERFVWDPRENIAEALRYAHRSIGDFGATIWKRGGWRRLLKGQLRVRAAATYVTHRLVRKVSVKLAPVLGELTHEARLYRETHRRFAALTKRGAKVWIVYSEGDLGLNELHTYFGEGGAKLAAYPNVSRAMVDAADHNFTHKGARERLLTALLGILAPADAKA